MRHLGKVSGAAVVLWLWGCGPDPSTQSTLRGRTSDELGAQKQALGGESLGGSGTVKASSQVRVSRINADGSLSTVAEIEAKAGGRYEAQLPAGEQKLIVQALDAAGSVRASAIVEHGGEAKQTVFAPPMDTETSVEAEVLQAMVANGVGLAEANAVDLRARINAGTAEAVKGSADAAARIEALAEAVAAAQRAQVRAHAEAGVQLSQEQLFAAQLQAAATLNAALDAAADQAAAEKAYAEFIASVQAAAREQAGDAKKASRGERAASVAFRSTVRARLQLSGQPADPVAELAARQAAALEARMVAHTAEAVLTAGGAGVATLEQVRTAGLKLQNAVSAAGTVSAAAQAFAAFHASIVGSTGVSSSILGTYLELNGATSATVQPTVTASANAAAQLDTALNAAASTALTATSALDVDAYAKAVVDAFKLFDAQVQAQAAALSGFGGQAAVAVELMAQANGSFRVAE